MIYLDNAATTYPKPHSVIDAVVSLLEDYGGNPGRGGHYFSRASSEKIYECRENLAKLINAESPENIVFTKNATEAINLAVKGCVEKGDEIIISSMEHNSVLRSCVETEKLGITVKIAKANPLGMVDKGAVEKLITNKTRLICITHVSNIVGTINPIYEICALAKSRNILTLVDCAQSGGILKIDATKMDMAAFAGHKGLYGPFGTGALYIRSGLHLDTLIEGGTGSMSESALMPSSLPERFEAGTLNACGIAGLNEGIKFVMKEPILEKEMYLTNILTENISVIKGAHVMGKPGVGVVGIMLPYHDCVDVSQRLDESYSIATRGGLHCAPMAHRTLGTIDKGLLRISTGYFNTKKDIDAVSSALENILHK